MGKLAEKPGKEKIKLMRDVLMGQQSAQLVTANLDFDYFLQNR